MQNRRPKTTNARASEVIAEAVLAWQGIEAHPHRFGGIEFKLGRREIGHVHGDHLVDIPFPKRIRDELVEAGKAEPHHVLPESGWVSVYLRAEGDTTRAIDLLRRSYDLALKQREGRRAS